MQIRKEAKIGIIVIFVLAAFIWGLNFLKGRNIFSSTDDYYLVYSNVSGLMESNSVLLSGYKVGLVTDIHMKGDKSGDIMVVITIENDVKIPAGSKAVLFNSDIMGTKAIKLEFSNSETFHQDGDTLSTRVEAGMLDQFLPMKDKIEDLVISVDSLVDRTADLFDEETRMKLKRSISDISGVTASVGEQQKKLDQMLANFVAISNNLKENNAEIDNILTNFSSLSDSLAKAEIASTMNNLNSTLEQTSLIMQKIQEGEGSIGMLVNNDSLYINLEKATESLDLLLKDLKEHPKRYVHFSVFGKKEK